MFPVRPEAQEENMHLSCPHCVVVTDNGVQAVPCLWCLSSGLGAPELLPHPQELLLQ
jgi:hypothetical protein